MQQHMVNCMVWHPSTTLSIQVCKACKTEVISCITDLCNGVSKGKVQGRKQGELLSRGIEGIHQPSSLQVTADSVSTLGNIVLGVFLGIAQSYLSRSHMACDVYLPLVGRYGQSTLLTGVNWQHLGM